MFGFIIGLYQPLFHDIARVLGGRSEGEIRLASIALYAGILSGASFSMWRMRELRLMWMIAANVLLPCACGRALYALGFESGGLLAAMVLVWLVPAAAVVLVYEVAGIIRRVRGRSSPSEAAPA